MDEAHQWLKSEAGHGIRPLGTETEFDWIRRENEEYRSGQLESYLIRLLEFARQLPSMFDWRIAPRPYRVWMYGPNPEFAQLERALYDGKPVPVPEGWDDVPPGILPGEISYAAHTPLLRMLGHFSEKLAKVSGCWSLGQATAFILTGERPKLPPMRVWAKELPGGGQRHFIEVYGALPWTDMQKLHRLLREQAGVKRKKGFSAEDLELVQFVEERRPAMKWREIMEVWNDNHPDRQYAPPDSTFQNAYSRASKRAQ